MVLENNESQVDNLNRGFPTLNNVKHSKKQTNTNLNLSVKTSTLTFLVMSQHNHSCCFWRNLIQAIREISCKAFWVSITQNSTEDPSRSALIFSASRSSFSIASSKCLQTVGKSTPTLSSSFRELQITSAKSQNCKVTEWQVDPPLAKNLHAMSKWSDRHNSFTIATYTGENRGFSIRLFSLHLSTRLWISRHRKAASSMLSFSVAFRNSSIASRVDVGALDKRSCRELSSRQNFKALTLNDSFSLGGRAFRHAAVHNA